MKKRVSILLCIVLCMSLLSGCNLAAKAGSVLKNVLHKSTRTPVTTAVVTGTLAPDDTNEQLDFSTPEETTDSTPEAETAQPEETAPPTQTAAPQPTAKPTPAPTPKPTAKPTPAPTPKPTAKPTPKPTAKPSTPASGDRETISSKELLQFFKQVAFGNSTTEVVYKWAAPIVVSVTGKFKSADDEFITTMLDTLNYYDGFPGAVYLSAAKAGSKANMEIKFVTAAELKKAQPKWNGDSTCYAAYRYNSNKQITHSTVYLVSASLPGQADRNILVAWGIFYSLGLFYDSTMYYDTVFNPSFYGDAVKDVFNRPVAADWYLVSFLYNKSVKPGMTYVQAAKVLAK